MIEIGISDTADSNFPRVHEAIRRQKSGQFRLQSGETIDGFVARHRAAIELLSQLHISIQGGYYSHKNPAGCINCDGIVGWSECILALESFGLVREEPSEEPDDQATEELDNEEER